MRFRILGSSSAGNSALICTDGCKVLLDAGFTGKRMEILLGQAGVGLEEIDAIFITHEHSDHVTGLRGLTRKRPDIKIFANETTARVVQERLSRRLNWQVFENNLSFVFRDLEVSPFSVPHDAYDPVGYRFCEHSKAGNRVASERSKAGDRVASRGDKVASERDDNTPRSLCWLTDLGYVTAAARRHALGADLLVIEANHDPDMLERCTTRSWSTKQRIRGRHGHLSNQAAYELLASAQNPRWRHVCLAHISAECNDLEIVEQQFAPLRNGAYNLDIHIFDPNRDEPGTEFNLRPQAGAAVGTGTGVEPKVEAGVELEAEAGVEVEIGLSAEVGVGSEAGAGVAAGAKVAVQGPENAVAGAEQSPSPTRPRDIRLTQIEISLNL